MQVNSCNIDMCPTRHGYQKQLMHGIIREQIVILQLVRHPKMKYSIIIIILIQHMDIIDLMGLNLQLSLIGTKLIEQKNGMDLLNQ